MKRLRVVGPQWLAEDLDAIPDPGYEATNGDYYYWCSGSHYARLTASGINLNFTSPQGVKPLLSLPNDLVKRDLQVNTISHIISDTDNQETLFSKPNDIKLFETFPARMRAGRDLKNILENLVNKDEKFLDLEIALSTPVAFIEEYRVYIINNRVALTTIYRNNSNVWGREASVTDYDKIEVLSVAREVISYMPNLPYSYVLDLGKLVNGNIIAIETNPASSSGWYVQDMNEHIRKIIRSSIISGQGIKTENQWKDPLIFYPPVALPFSSPIEK